MEWTLADSWIWAELQQLVRDVERLFQSFQYGEAGRQIYEFFWSDFADWYVEIAKLQLQKDQTKTQTVVILVRILDMSLRLLHPFTPFITEELWGHLREAVQDSSISNIAGEWPEALIVAQWPKPIPREGWEESKAGDFMLIQEIVRSIRNFRTEKAVSSSKRLAAMLIGGDKTELLTQQGLTIATLAGLDPAMLSIHQSLKQKSGENVVLVVGPVEIHLPLVGLVDRDAQLARLTKELIDTRTQIDRLEKLLSSDFASKAPESIVQKEREKLAAFQLTAEKIKAQMDI